MSIESACSKQDLVSIKQTGPPRYKPSRFNARTVNADGSLILYNSYTGRTCVFPAAARSRVSQILSARGFTGAPDGISKYLFEKGYIVTDDTDENALWAVRYGRQQFRTDVLQLILLSSEDCNFRCVYCNQNFKRGQMHPEVRLGVRNLVLGRLSMTRFLGISWFGGEPMLGYEAIAELSPFFQRICKDHGVAYTSHITTNGYLLTPERFSEMIDWGITDYQITVDGDAADHDKHRVLKDGGGTFNEIVANIEAMQHHDRDFQVAVRINFDRVTVARVGALFERLKTTLAGDRRFRMTFHPVFKSGGPNDESLDICSASEGRGHIERLRREAWACGLSSEGAVESLEPLPDKNVCYAARPYNFVIGADGKVMKCTVALDTRDENIVGQLTPDGDLHLRNTLLKWIQPYYTADKMCSKCFFVPVCEGAYCPLPRVIEGTRACPPQKLEIGKVLRSVADEQQHISGRSVKIGLGTRAAVLPTAGP
jgi:uncharacterized protein